MTTPVADYQTVGYLNLAELLTARWPAALPQLPADTVLDHLWVSGLSTERSDGTLAATATLLLERELVLSIPGLDAVAVVLAAADGGTRVPARITVLPEFAITLERLPVALRLRGDLLRPVRRAGGGWEADPTSEHLDITLAEVTITVTADGDITLAADGAITLPPCMIGESGVVVEAHDIGVHLSADDPPPGQPAGWKGIHLGSASLSLPGDLAATVGTLALTDAYIGNGGFTGAVSDTWTPALSAELFGMEVTLARAEVEFVQNAPVSCALSGTITLPFFDQPVGVDLQVGIDGSIGVTVAAVQPPGAQNDGGLLTLTKADLFTMRLDSLGFRYAAGVFTAVLSGTLTPRIGEPELHWPGVTVQELSIDSAGNVRIDGGWLNLPSQYSLDFHGFQVALTRLGMGRSDDGGRWIGFSGSVKLVDGIGIGGSVDGLRITWYGGSRAPKLTLDGVGVELEIPETLKFKGTVAFHELPGPERRFDGAVTLDLLALGLRVDGQIVIGRREGPDGPVNYFALYVGLDLPAGIPLWSTGLALYGLAGLVAVEMAPNKGAAPNALHPQSRTDEEWYENADGSPGWYKRPEPGVTDLASKWDPQPGGLAVGGGITIGTVADNGFTFNGSMLLVISLPGPVILLEGRANLLSERATLGDDPDFRALMVLDYKAGDVLVGLGASYRFGSGGELIEIGADAEAYFDFHDPTRWHVHLGEPEPRERRVRAQLIKIFESNGYLTLNADQLALGAWVGYAANWHFSPVTIALESWLQGDAVLSRKPAYLSGALWLHGKVELSVFGIGFGLGVDARLSAGVFDPFHLLAELSVHVKTPWPLPDFDVDLTLEWGPTPQEPALPLPLQEIAVEHFKSTASWPLPRASLLRPDLDAGGGVLPPLPLPPAPLDDPPPVDAPVVPLDARPHLTFSRSVHDDALVGGNPQPPWPAAVPAGYERIGDPAANQGPMRVRSGLKEIVLSRWTGAGWEPVAGKGPSAAGLPELFGSWAPVPQLPAGTVTPGTDPPVAQVKLWLWSRSTFDYTRHGGSAYDEWFTRAYPGYPCLPPVPSRTICRDFDGIPAETVLPLPYAGPPHPEIGLTASAPPVVSALPAAAHGHTQALYFDATPTGPGGELTVGLDGPAAGTVTLVFAPPPPVRQTTRVDADTIPGQRVTLPFQWGDLRLTMVDHQNRPLGTAPLRTTSGRRGIGADGTATLDLPFAVDWVAVTVLQGAAGATLTAFGPGGNQVASTTAPAVAGVTQLVLAGGGITRLVVAVPGDGNLLAEVGYGRSAPGTLTARATAVDDQGTQHGPFTPVGDTITVSRPGLRSVHVRGDGRLGLVQVCASYPPDPGQVAAYSDMATRLTDSLAQWSQTSQVLAPDTAYRLTVVTSVDAVGEGALSGVRHTVDLTELAYFRTQGPPALTTLSPADPDPGLSDLTRYVAQTVPATVPAAGQQPLLPRPVYRGYDVGVVFNEDYVDLLYRLARRDLRLHLYGANNTLVRDAAGRLVGSANRWGRTESLTLSASEQRYLTLIDRSTCLELDPVVIPRQLTLFGADQGMVLEPDALCEARLVPLLCHEEFAGGLAGWTVVDAGTMEGPSAWAAVAGGGVRQTANIWGGVADAADPAKPGTMLVGGGADWTDYRFTVQLRSSDDDAIGVVFRYLDAANHYRFSMDAQLGYRRLVRIAGGVCTVLAEDGGGYRGDSDYEVTAEVVGTGIRVYLDGATVFAVTDGALAHGRIGLYCWANDGARFADVRVEDLRPTAPVAYRFPFTTSRYANFHHHLHSYPDQTWVAAAADPGIAAEVAAAVAPGTAPSDAESRAYASLAGKVLGAAGAATLPETVTVDRITAGGTPAGLLVRGPEPIDWSRTTLTVSAAPLTAAARQVPGTVKLTEVATGGTEPNEETVTLLAADGAALGDLGVVALGIPGPLLEAGGDRLLDDTFDAPGGVLYEQRFGPDALAGYRIVDAPGAVSGPSAWAVSGAAIVQTSNIHTNPIGAADPVKAGTVAVTGPRLRDFRLTAALRSSDNDAIGIVFRYSDDQNWYRFSMDRQLSYRRLVRCVGGTVTVLWQDAVAYDLNRLYQLRVEAFGDGLVGFLDDRLLFAVRDGGVRDGQVGLYCWRNTGCSFEALRVESLPADPLLFRPPLASRTELSIVDSGSTGGPSAWAVAAGTVTQSSPIAGPAGPAAPGTVALLAPRLADTAVSVVLRSGADGALGVVFRYTDPGNWYRFSMSRNPGYRRLVKCVAGVVTVLWQDSTGHDLDNDYPLTLVADGSRLAAWLKGSPLFDVTDAALGAGRIGLYACGAPAARFSGLAVTDPGRWVGRWRIVDTGGQSAWRSGAGLLTQRAAVPGSSAVGGSAGWRDYRVTVRGSVDAGAAFGLVLRRTDHANLYRLVVDTQTNLRQLVRVTAGVPTVLWQQARGYPAGQPYTLVVDALGDRLVGHLDQQPLFDLTDAGHPAGQVGLYAANGAARVDRITVAEPPLDAYPTFRDRFDAGDLASWTIVDEGAVGAPSAWSVSGGELLQTSDIHSLPPDPAAVAKRGTIALAGDPQWRDVVLAARFTSTDPDAIGVLFRYADANNFYRFSMSHTGGYRRLVRCVAGVFSTLWEQPAGHEVGHGYELVVAAVGGRLTGWLSGVPAFDVEDAALPAGRIGLYCWANGGARFSGVRVYRPDRLAGASLLADDFGVETAGRWSFVTNGDHAGPAVWQTTGGELRQTSGVWGGAVTFAELAKPGTVALAGDTTWTDYRVTVRLMSVFPDAVGVVFRYADPDNWYRFSMDRNLAYRRLVRCAGGTITVLWQDVELYETGRSYLLTVDAVGDTLTGYLDGVPLFAVRDQAVPAGGIGLYCWRNPTARFSSVRVTAAGWSEHYRFGPDEPPVPAGTRIAIHSGNEADWTGPPVAGLTHRFAATLLDRGRRRLPTDVPVQLRLRHAGDRAGHARPFVPPAAYTPVPAEVLRKADGTAFAVFIPAATPLGTALPPAEYRLRLTYHRDNTAADPGSAVLTQGGDASDEVVVLDVPWTPTTPAPAPGQ